MLFLKSKLMIKKSEKKLLKKVLKALLWIIFLQPIDLVIFIL